MVILTGDVKYATNIYMVTGTFFTLCTTIANTYRCDDFVFICVTPSRDLSSYTLRTISLPGVWSFYTLVSGVAQHQCARPHPREGYITCCLGNITVQERYGQHS